MKTQAVAGPVRPAVPLVLLRLAPVRARRVRPRPDVAPRRGPVPVRGAVRPPVDACALEPDHGGRHRPGRGADGSAPPTGRG